MKDIRNIAILAHIDAGKTTLSERILWTTGKILRAGNVEDGLATMDYLFEEKAKGITIEAGISNFEWRNIWWNLIDAPGHIDFSIEADSALEAADAAILVISAVDGIQPQTFSAWEKLKSLKKPCIIFFNKTDLPESRLEESFWEIEEQFGKIPVLLSWTEQEGVWDILSGAYLKNTAEGKEDIFEKENIVEVQNLRREAAEAASIADDNLLQKLLAKENIETKELLEGLQKLFKKDSHIFCYAGSAKKNIGIRSLLNGLSFFVKPTKAEEKIIRWRSFAGIGEVAIVKNSLKEIPNGLKYFRIHAQQLTQITEVFPNDIYAVKGLEHRKIGDYMPLLQMRIECVKSDDFQKIADALKSIERIDPSVKVTENNNDGSWTLHAMGAVQFDFILSKLKREFNCEIRAGEPSVQVKEILANDVGPVENFCQIGDTSVSLELSAKCVSNSSAIIEGYEEGEVFDAFISAAEEFCEAGVLGKGELYGIKFIVNKLEINGKSQTVFKKAFYDAAKKLVLPSAVKIEEPWVNLTVQCKAAFAGVVANDLLSRGAKILSSDGDGVHHRFYANAPLSKLYRYTTELLSITQGSGNYSFKLSEP